MGAKVSTLCSCTPEATGSDCCARRGNARAEEEGPKQLTLADGPLPGRSAVTLVLANFSDSTYSKTKEVQIGLFKSVELTPRPPHLGTTTSPCRGLRRDPVPSGTSHTNTLDGSMAGSLPVLSSWGDSSENRARSLSCSSCTRRCGALLLVSFPAEIVRPTTVAGHKT